MEKFRRIIEPFAGNPGKAPKWKATLLKGEKIVFSKIVRGSYKDVNKAIDRAQTNAAGKRTQKKTAKMPKRKRPRDLAQLAKLVVDIATGRGLRAHVKETRKRPGGRKARTIKRRESR